MLRTIWVPALALGAVLATNGFAVAQQRDAAKPEARDGFTMTLGGTGTAAQAAADDDTELTHFYRHHYYGHGHGYRGYYGGWGGYYGRGWGGYYGGYRPYYAGFYRPYYGGGWGGYYGGYGSYYSSYSVYRSYPTYYGDCCYPAYSYYGVNGNESDLAAPATLLGSSAAKNPVAAQPAPDTPAPGSTFRYDGGPANPVPQPKPDANPTSRAKAEPAGLPVSLPKSKPASPYTYKAYGEK